MREEDLNNQTLSKLIQKSNATPSVDLWYTIPEQQTGHTIFTTENIKLHFK